MVIKWILTRCKSLIFPYCAVYVDNTRLYLIDERCGTEQTQDLSTTLVRTSSGSDYCHLRLLFDLESIRELKSA